MCLLRSEIPEPAASKRSARAPVYRSGSDVTRRRVTASVRIQKCATQPGTTAFVLGPARTALLQMPRKE
jgi:hypothetical protein